MIWDSEEGEEKGKKGDAQFSLSTGVSRQIIVPCGVPRLAANHGEAELFTLPQPCLFVPNLSFLSLPRETILLHYTNKTI